MRKILWSDRARADVRRLDRDTAMRIFAALLRFAETGKGDVKKLKGESDDLRLRLAITVSALPKKQTTLSGSKLFVTEAKPIADPCS